MPTPLDEPEVRRHRQNRENYASYSAFVQGHPPRLPAGAWSWGITHKEVMQETHVSVLSTIERNYWVVHDPLVVEEKQRWTLRRSEDGEDVYNLHLYFCRSFRSKAYAQMKAGPGPRPVDPEKIPKGKHLGDDDDSNRSSFDARDELVRALRDPIIWALSDPHSDAYRACVAKYKYHAEIALAIIELLRSYEEMDPSIDGDNKWLHSIDEVLMGIVRDGYYTDEISQDAMRKRKEFMRNNVFAALRRLLSYFPDPNGDRDRI